MLSSGHLLADRYRLARRIAVGGMGEVWEAEDARLDRKVAVKVLKAELCGDAEFLHRFRVEARTTASLNHPGVAGVHDYGETNALSDDGPQDTAYLVMELVEGEPLAAVLSRDGRVSVETTLDMLEQAAHALQAAHARGLVHRDIKPGNILLTPTGTVKLTDFGIAKAADAAPVTRSGMVMGTAHYIAPEQAVGQEATPASDVYSLAVVGYECLVGHRPFRAENAVTVAMMHIRDTPPPLPLDVPPAVRTLIEATLVKDPARRYATGGEFAAAVAAVRANRPAPAPTGNFPAVHPLTPASGANPVLSGPGGGPSTGPGRIGRGAASSTEDHTPPTGMPVSPASALPMPRGPQTPPHPTPMAPVNSGSPHTGALHSGAPHTGALRSGALHTGPHGLPASAPPQPDRARIWLWALLVLLLLIAATLIGWAIVSASTAADAPTGSATVQESANGTAGVAGTGDTGTGDTGNGATGGHDRRGDGAGPGARAPRTGAARTGAPRYGPAPGRPFDPPSAGHGPGGTSQSAG